MLPAVRAWAPTGICRSRSSRQRFELRERLVEIDLVIKVGDFRDNLTQSRRCLAMPTPRPAQRMTDRSGRGVGVDQLTGDHPCAFQLRQRSLIRGGFTKPPMQMQFVV